MRPWPAAFSRTGGGTELVKNALGFGSIADPGRLIRHAYPKAAIEHTSVHVKMLWASGEGMAPLALFNGYQWSCPDVATFSF